MELTVVKSIGAPFKISWS